MLFDHTDFVERQVSVSAWKNGQKVELSVTDGDVQLPEEKGEYILEINLDTDHGKARYVGRMNISNK